MTDYKKQYLKYKKKYLNFKKMLGGMNIAEQWNKKDNKEDGVEKVNEDFIKQAVIEAEAEAKYNPLIRSRSDGHYEAHLKQNGEYLEQKTSTTKSEEDEDSYNKKLKALEERPGILIIHGIEQEDENKSPIFDDKKLEVENNLPVFEIGTGVATLAVIIGILFTLK